MRRLNTSFCWLPVVPVLRYTVLCGDQTRPSAGVRIRHSGGGFVFPLLPVCFCRAVQADFVRRLLSVPFALSAHRFSLCLERDCEYEGEHISR